jgi:hypothetical protein
MGNQEIQQTNQEVHGLVNVKSFTFYKLDTTWTLDETMDEIVRSLDDVVRENWDKLYSPEYNEKILDKIEKVLKDVEKEKLSSGNLLFDFKILYWQSAHGSKFYDFLLRLANIKDLKYWVKQSVVDIDKVDKIDFDILVSRYRTMMPSNKQELYTSVKFAQHTVWITKSIVEKCAQDSNPDSCIETIAQLIANKIGFSIPTLRENTWKVWI